MHEYLTRMTVTEFREYRKALTVFLRYGVSRETAIEIICGQMQQRHFNMLRDREQRMVERASDNGRYISGHRVYSDGSMREDFRSDC